MLKNKIIIFSFLWILLVQHSISQSKFEREKRVEIDEVPTKAVDFISKIPVKKVKWIQEESQDGTSFEAKFSYKNFKYSVEFTKNGELIDVEKTVNFKSLSIENQDAIKRYFKENYQEVKIKKVQIQYKGLDDELVNIFNNPNRNQIKARLFFEIVVKAKREDETALYEILFDEVGNQIKTLQFTNDNLLNLEF